jgi:hypothetical protein
VKLEQAIGRPCFIIEKYRYDDESLAGMSIDELKILKTRIEMKIQILATQIKAKKIEFAEGGKGATREWYMNHKYALNINQRMFPFLADLIRQRNREERSLSDYFVDEARIYLDKEIFNNILRNAEREKNLLTEPTGKKVEKNDPKSIFRFGRRPERYNNKPQA